MQITFDPGKNRRNAADHDGVTFEEAKEVLSDAHALVREDDDATGEQRFVSLGGGAKDRILVVIWTLRDNHETIRLISAWKANAQQRRRYENQFV